MAFSAEGGRVEDGSDFTENLVNLFTQVWSLLISLFSPNFVNSVLYKTELAKTRCHDSRDIYSHIFGYS